MLVIVVRVHHKRDICGLVAASTHRNNNLLLISIRTEKISTNGKDKVIDQESMNGYKKMVSASITRIRLVIWVHQSRRRKDRNLRVELTFEGICFDSTSGVTVRKCYTDVLLVPIQMV